MIHILSDAHARRLLDRYYQGISTPEEEAALTEYLCHRSAEELQPDLHNDARLFAELSSLRSAYNDQLDQTAERQLPAGFEQRLQAHIDHLADNTPRAPLAENPSRPAESRPALRRQLTAASIAAVIVLAVAIFSRQSPSDAPVFADTCSSPQEAEIQMTRALSLLQAHSSDGLEQARSHAAHAAQIEHTADRFLRFD